MVNFRRKEAKFLKLFVDEMDYLTKEVLKDNEIVLLTKLTKHICYRSSCLVVNGCREDSRPLTQTEIIGVSGKAKQNAIPIIKGLVNKKVLFEGKRGDKDKIYFVNPYLFMRGNDINKSLLKMFQPIIKK